MSLRRPRSTNTPGQGASSGIRILALTASRTPKRSVHFWIPLNDHAENAGTMMFVPGSHRNVPAQGRVRTRSGDSRATDVSENVTPVGVPLSVGSFSIHTPWTRHGSDPNLSGQIRKALVLEFSTGAWSAARQVGPSLVSGLLTLLLEDRDFVGAVHSERLHRCSSRTMSFPACSLAES